MENILNDFDFDNDRNAIIEPWFIAKPISGFPEIASPIYGMKYNNVYVAFYKSRVGASACALELEKIISKGVRTVVMFGSCGVLDKEIVEEHLIIPISAFRDEGTSYHYTPSSQEIEMDTESVDILTTTMDKMGYPWLKGKTWTTDAPMRETVKKTALRKSQGCISVEMECSAMIAVAKFRKIKFAQFLYAADNLDAPSWESRNLFNKNLTQREKYFTIALETAIALHKV
jgi:uridine phosphorylase